MSENQSHTSEFLKGAVPPKDLKTFYIIRHGDTLKYSRNGQIVPAEKEINGVKHWYTQGGGNDNPLSKEGRAQAEALAPLIAKEPITKIWCSPASRAQETAKLPMCATSRWKLTITSRKFITANGSTITHQFPCSLAKIPTPRTADNIPRTPWRASNTVVRRAKPFSLTAISFELSAELWV